MTHRTLTACIICAVFCGFAWEFALSLIGRILYP